MADLCDVDEIVTKFLLSTCRLRQRFNFDALQVCVCRCALAATSRGSSDDDDTEFIATTTGSVAEFYIQPMLTCVGDVDVMLHRGDELAIPAGTPPSTELPHEFHSRVEVYEIVDSEYPGYVYLVSSHTLTERIDDGMYSAVDCQPQYLAYAVHDDMHGPAAVTTWSSRLEPVFCVRLAGAHFSRDDVYCIRCLSWPPQASYWPTRNRSYGWPDSATIDRVVSNGCDVVRVAHRRCRQDELMRRIQYRMSFSRAEIVLLNSWTLVQQIIYHMLRVFAKNKRLTDSAMNSDAATLSNYHIKTLMLWACELKPRSWWMDDLNVVRVSVELLHTLGVWLTVSARCPHYFIHNCNLFDHTDNRYCELASMLGLMSETEASLAEWFINNYIRKCAQFCPDSVAWLFDDVSTKSRLQTAVTAVVDWALNMTRVTAPCIFTAAQVRITFYVSRFSLTACSCLSWLRDLLMIDRRFILYFTAFAFLHVAFKTKDPLKGELLDVLTICLQSNDVSLRRYMNARHSSMLSLSQAAKLMKVVVNSSRSTVQLIEIELSKAYLYRALKCNDCNSDSIYCLTNVYLAVLCYTTGHYQTAIDHCTLVTRSQDHSQCSSHVVQGELLPNIDDDVDTVLGLAVFYQYMRATALNQQQKHVSVFTTELFAHYLHIKSLSVINCRQLTQTSSADGVQRYQKCFYEWQDMFTTDVLVFRFVNRTKYATNGQRQMVVSGQRMPRVSRPFDTSELVELLQQSAVKHLTTFRQLEAQEFRSIAGIVTTDFEALYAYKCGEYERCFQLSAGNVRTLIGVEGISCIFAYPEFIQLMDDDIASLYGLIRIVNPSCEVQPFHNFVCQLILSLYLMAQCQLVLHRQVTSFAQTLDYVEVARRYLDKDFTLDQLLLKLTERKILLYINGKLV